MQTQQKREAGTSRALGIVNRKKKNLLEAVRFFHEAVAQDPKDYVSLMNLAEIFDENKKTVYAVEYSMRAVLAAPEVRSCKQKFLDITAPCSFSAYSADLQRALHICLESPDMNCSKLSGLWEGLLRLGPHFSSIYKVDISGSDPDFNREAFDNAGDYGALLDPFFLAGLNNLTVGIPAFENFLIYLRRWLLSQRDASEKAFTDNDYIRLAAALSHYCCFTDYIFYTPKEEKHKIAQLKISLEAAREKPDERDLVLYACYEPLYGLQNAQKLAALSAHSGDAARVVREQIVDYFELQERRRSVISLTAIDDAVSKEVQAQYEEFPYPRWKSFPPLQQDERLNERLAKKGAKLLVAGCGTGQDPLGFALAFPGLEILAIDLSRSSLAYAMRKAEEYGVTNITFRQADILKLGSLDVRFDYIASSGVLHHMKEPRTGLRVLEGLLKPGGILRLGLYSKSARHSIVAARKAIAAGDYSNDAEGMKLFRHRSPRLLEATVLQELQGFLDYYSLPMYRDLLFHVHEHRYAIRDIKKMMKDFNLTFDTFFFSDDTPQRYLRMFPGDRRANDLDRWEIFEKEHPTAFMGMYQFWCHKA